MDWVYAALLGTTSLGSIPFGLLLAKAAGKGDIRQIGSGNIGATNVLRTGSKGLAAAALLLDAAKGFAAVLAAWRWLPDAVAARGARRRCSATASRCGSRFKGGKGVATNAGVSFGLAWPIGVAYARGLAGGAGGHPRSARSPG